MAVQLEARIEVAPSFSPGQPVIISFILTNTGDKDAYILTWYTPLENLWSDCLRILRNGEQVEYEGPLAKRGRPSPEDYILIPAGRSVSKDVDLSSAYQVTVSGNYDVSLESLIQSPVSTTEFAGLSRGAELSGRRIERLQSDPVRFVVEEGGERRMTLGEAMRTKVQETSQDMMASRSPLFNGGTASQQTVVLQAHNDGYGLLSIALATLADGPEYREWFGSHTITRFNKVRDTYDRMKTMMDGKTFTYDLTGTGCRPNIYAYTTKGGSTIWLCDLFWNAPTAGVDSKAGTIVHEHSHASGSTDDIAYGQESARELAASSPDQAIRNADNFEYYSGG